MAAVLFGCGEPAVPQDHDIAGSTEQSAAKASFAQGTACEPAPSEYSEPEPSGTWPLQIGVPSDQRDFNLLGPGCRIPVTQAFQGRQFARLSVRFSGEEDQSVYAQASAASLEDPAAEIATDVSFDVKKNGVCESDGYCYISSIHINVGSLAETQDELRSHAVEISVHLFEADNESRFGRTQLWGRLRLPDEEDEEDAGP